MASQRRLARMVLGELLDTNLPANSAIAGIAARHHALLGTDPNHVIESGLTDLLLEQAAMSLETGDVAAALAAGRCVYVLTRRIGHGWLPYLNILIAANVFPDAPIMRLPETLIARGKVAAIPRRIIQYWDQPSPPADVAAMIATWRAARGFFHKLVDDAQARKFLDLHYGARITAAYDAAGHVASKADIFRLAWLYQRGGVYADADEKLVGQIDSVIPSECSVLLTWAEGIPPCIQNGFIAAEPLNKLIESALMIAVKRVEYANQTGVPLNAWIKTGPGVISMAVLDDFAIHGKPVAAAGLHLMRDAIHRNIIQSDEFLEYRKLPSGNWRL
jgi:hypothetical protein